MIQFLVDQIRAAVAGNELFAGGAVLMGLGIVLAGLRQLPAKLWRWFLYLFTISIDVTSTDQTFQWVLLWLNQQPYIHRTKRVAIKYTHGRPVIVPAHGNHFFTWQGKPVWLRWIDEEGKIDPLNMGSVTREKITLRILGRNQELIRSLLSEARELLKVEEADLLKVFLRKDGYENNWKAELRSYRSLRTLFLPEAGLGLLQDMTRFLGSETWYRQRGIPYRRGYLFHGPPGNGKSSVALGLASALKIPLYVLNLASISNDQALEKAIYSIDTSKPLMLLIEDIDTAAPDRVRDKVNQPFSLGTLLNVLDGIVARENLILVVTTNKKDMLDPALLRPGRIDQTIEFTDASWTQIQDAIKVFFPGGNSHAEETLLPLRGTVSMASVQEVLLSLALEERDKRVVGIPHAY